MARLSYATDAELMQLGIQCDKISEIIATAHSRNTQAVDIKAMQIALSPIILQKLLDEKY